MSKLALRKASDRAHLPWQLHRGAKVLCAFPTGSEALTFLRELFTAARP